MNKIDSSTYSLLTKVQLIKLRKACKIANLDFKSMAIRPTSAIELIKEVEKRNNIVL